MPTSKAYEQRWRGNKSIYPNGKLPQESCNTTLPIWAWFPGPASPRMRPVFLAGVEVDWGKETGHPAKFGGVKVALQGFWSALARWRLRCREALIRGLAKYAGTPPRVEVS